MKKYIITILFAFSVLLNLSAQKHGEEMNYNNNDSLLLGYQLYIPQSMDLFTTQKATSETFDNSPHIDISKALYGKIAGLNVYQGVGQLFNNISTLSIHGQSPLVLVDGYPRNIEDIVAAEIESVTVLKDAISVALYGVRGANGVVMITTKRGKNQRLKITTKYQMGVNTQFRSPDFADSYTYATKLNEALLLDGLNPRYDSNELNAFKNNMFPYDYPNVDWWKESYNNVSYNHRLNLTFNGGNERFRYFTAMDYMHDKGFFKYNTTDSRYNSKPTDVRLNLRANIDVNVTSSTFFKLGVVSKLMETNRARYESIFNAIYNTPSAAFPIRYSNEIFGGNSTYTFNNPVALLTSTGNHKTTFSTLLADASLKQNLNALVDGLAVELSVAFDNFGSMYDTSSKEYRYIDSRPSILDDGITLVTDPVIYRRDSEVLSHGQGFTSLYLRTNMQGKLSYEKNFSEVHNLLSALIYDQQSFIRQGRNQSAKRQSILATAMYSFRKKYSLGAVMNYSGTAYLPKTDRYRLYPAVSASWVVSEEDFVKNTGALDYLKLYASIGTSGWDGNLSHELYRQGYGGQYGNGYFFTDNASQFWGQGEGPLPVENLTVEKSTKTAIGFVSSFLNNRLNLTFEGFNNKRSDILVPSGASVSEVIGINVGYLNAGIQKYYGFDAAFSWEEKINKFKYKLYANGSYLDTKIVNDNQEFQEYDYLYRKGNRVNQFYGLEVVGIFHDQMEINNSAVQTFSIARPGDLKYRDQNGDGIINNQDVVKMFGSSIPRFYFGFGLNLAYENFELLADFQGLTGRTVNLLNSKIYSPLVENGNISNTFLKTEIPWTPENASVATMPRLTTLANANNYYTNSLWLRDGSFIKLRNLMLAYTFPKSLTSFADVKVYVQGTNLFSLDNIKTLDPEQLGTNYPVIRSYWAGIKLNF